MTNWSLPPSSGANPYSFQPRAKQAAVGQPPQARSGIYSSADLTIEQLGTHSWDDLKTRAASEARKNPEGKGLWQYMDKLTQMDPKEFSEMWDTTQKNNLWNQVTANAQKPLKNLAPKNMNPPPKDGGGDADEGDGGDDGGDDSYGGGMDYEA